MAYVPLEDETGSYEAVMFEDEMPNEWPEENSVVVAGLKLINLRMVLLLMPE